MTHKSLDLKVISRVTPEESAPVKELGQRRRVPRLNLSDEQFRLAYNGKIFAIVDLSLEGMAFRVIDQDDLGVFSVAAKIEGTLNLDGKRHEVKAQVRHIRSDLVGCRFEELKNDNNNDKNNDTYTALSQFLDPAILGSKLRPIPAPEGGLLWYRAPSGTNFLLWRGTDGHYSRVMMHILGNFVQWDSEDGLSTGRIEPSKDQSEVRGIISLDTVILTADITPDQYKLGIAKTLLMSSKLPNELKVWCARQFGEAQNQAH